MTGLTLDNTGYSAFEGFTEYCDRLLDRRGRGLAQGVEHDEVVDDALVPNGRRASGIPAIIGDAMGLDAAELARTRADLDRLTESVNAYRESYLPAG